MAEAASTSGPFDGIDHISTYCFNFAQTRSFYREQLGLEEFFHSTATEEGTEVDGFGQSAYTLGGTDVELACKPSSQIQPGPVAELGLRVSDVKKLHRDLTENGCSTGPPTEGSIFGTSSISFTVRNPDAVLLRMFQSSPA
jgi:catechol 2,3-dioxygenase-like lactoylglutathione lyase family enzyme